MGRNRSSARRTRQPKQHAPRAAVTSPPAPTDGADEEPQALVVTHTFDAGSTGGPFTAVIRLTGSRVGVHGSRRPDDTFVCEDRIQDLIPNGAPVSVTTWIHGVARGEWTVRADLTRVEAGPPGARPPGPRRGPERLARGSWSWRHWTVGPRDDEPIRTRWALLAPLAPIPAVVPGSWPALGALGVVLALVIQTAILAGRGWSVGSVLGVSLVAVVAGLATAKIWFAVLQPGPWRQSIARGWAVDGFLVAAPVTAVGLLLAQGLPVGPFLDAAAPGMFVAVAIGRVGCFFTGCCAGRMSHSRWSLWSSDRKVGARRLPAQLVESAVGLAIALGAGLLVVVGTGLPEGLVFVAAFAAYAAARQLLLRIRAESRPFSWRRRAAEPADAGRGSELAADRG